MVSIYIKRVTIMEWFLYIYRELQLWNGFYIYIKRVTIMEWFLYIERVTIMEWFLYI